MSNKLIYELVDGLGDSITCDDCYKVVKLWWTDGTRAICTRCKEQRKL